MLLARGFGNIDRVDLASRVHLEPHHDSTRCNGILVGDLTLQLAVDFLQLDTVKGTDRLTGESRTNGLWGAMKAISYARHRFPPDVIRHAVCST